jgi:hypothetical protein
MARFAELFATLNTKGKVGSVTSAYPPHELSENQIPLTPKEYALLRAVKSIEEAKALLDSVEYKISQVMK